MSGQKVTVTRVQLLEAARKGQETADQDGSPLDCPWSAAGSANDRMLVAAWMRAFTHRRSELDRS